MFFDPLQGPCVMKAGYVSCLLVFETLFRADSHFLSMFKTCRESSPVLEEGRDWFLASAWATPALFQACLTASAGSSQAALTLVTVPQPCQCLSVYRPQISECFKVHVSDVQTWTHTMWTVRTPGVLGLPGGSFVPCG